MTLLAYHSGGLKQLSREPTADALSKTTQLRPKGTLTKANYGRLLQHTQALISGGTVRRITKAVLGGLAGSALVLGGTQAASAALEAKFWFRDGLTDLVPTAPGPFDSAKARITIAKRTNDKTTLRIHIKGIDSSIAGRTLGSHLHTGACVEGNGTAAGPHYNQDVIVRHKTLPVSGQEPGSDTAEVSPKTEVWFDLVPDQDGLAVDQTTVPFEPIDPDGVMSVVVHELPTDKDGSTATGIGSAGPRQACFPLSVSGIFPTKSTE